MKKKLSKKIKRKSFSSYVGFISKKIFKVIQNNKLVVLLLLLYAISMLSVITWGLPNQNHPFNYYMDEWHQMSSVRALFTQGSPNVAGAANGTIFHFFLSGILLGPFVVFHIVNPFVIKSALVAMEMQERLFIVLRLNTLFFGLLSGITIAYIAKKYLNASSVVAVLLLIFNPIWIYQSNVFKYDIALAFWILIALVFLFRFGSSPTLKNFLLAGIFCALTFATKVSALVMFPIYILAYFYFMPPKKRKYKHIFLGIGVFLLTFCVFGIPDLLLQIGDIREYLRSNIVESPRIYDNYILDFNPWWLYLFFFVLPLDFGYVFHYLTAFAVCCLAILVIKNRANLKVTEFKNYGFLLICFGIFWASLISINLGASGNRIVVLIPFMALFCAISFSLIKNKFSGIKLKIISIFVILLFSIQIAQSLIMVYAKFLPDTRQQSSVWIVSNIQKGSIIGLENIPIYQMLPDLMLKEFYSLQADPSYNARFEYKIINSTDNSYPQFVIVTNREFEVNYLKKSEKKSLVQKLEQSGYSVVKEFKPSQILYQTMGNERSFFMSVLLIEPTIAIYEKNSLAQN